jgi:hypothetical protein
MVPMSRVRIVRLANIICIHRKRIDIRTRQGWGRIDARQAGDGMAAEESAISLADYFLRNKEYPVHAFMGATMADAPQHRK